MPFDGPSGSSVSACLALCPTVFLAISDIRFQRADLCQVQDRCPVLRGGDYIHIGVAETYIARLIVSDVVHHRTSVGSRASNITNSCASASIVRAVS